MIHIRVKQGKEKNHMIETYRKWEEECREAQKAQKAPYQVGQEWYVRYPGCDMLAKVRITDITERTVEMQRHGARTASVTDRYAWGARCPEFIEQIPIEPLGPTPEHVKALQECEERMQRMMKGR